MIKEDEKIYRCSETKELNTKEGFKRKWEIWDRDTRDMDIEFITGGYIEVKRNKYGEWEDVITFAKREDDIPFNDEKVSEEKNKALEMLAVAAECDFNLLPFRNR